MFGLLITEGWIDVMVSPTQRPAFYGYQSQVNVEDVQALLEVHEEDRKTSRIVGDFFTDYPTHGEVLVWINEEIAKHPQVQRVNIGQTYNGNDIEGVVLGNTAQSIVYIHCGIHAREWITVTTCCWIIDGLLNEDPDGPELLDQYLWIIIPIFNVDGYDYTHTSDRLWRKNRLPNQGSTCAGTDINRNYGYGWGGPGSSNQPCSETYRGAFAYATQEAAAERDFLQPYFNTGRVFAYFDIHSYGAYYMSAWGYSASELPPDYGQMDGTMRSAVQAIQSVNGRTYTFGASGRVLYLTSGGTVDWAYGDGGVIQSYTIEAFGSNFTPPASWIPVIGPEIWEGVKDAVIQRRGKQ